ncbi:MAG: levansucrase [Alphaproteobacteria bacterium]|nr:levansucrase [Alphaproteobacteria bacterium]
MVLALHDQWIWDFWLTRDGGDWHIHFLKADKSLGDPNLRHRNVTIGHAISQNLVDWTYLGTCFSPRQSAGFDDWTTWTGSIIADRDGRWHMYYTGTTHGDGGLKQRIGHAISADLHTWTRVSDEAALDISGPDYEEYTPGHWHDRAMRDPHVIPDPRSNGYLMYFTARVPGIEEPNAGGSIGFATSPDLYTWTLQPPVFAGGLFGQMEVPQVVNIGERWYCLFCPCARHFSKEYARTYPGMPVGGTHYLMASHPGGPWQIAPGPFLDGDTPTRRYAGKLVKIENDLKFLAFVHDGPEGEFVGEIGDPLDVTIDGNGLLHLREDGAMRNAV